MAVSIDMRAIFIGAAALAFLFQNPALMNAQQAQLPKMPAYFTSNGHLSNPCRADEFHPAGAPFEDVDMSTTGSLPVPVSHVGCR